MISLFFSVMTRSLVMRASGAVCSLALLGAGGGLEGAYGAEPTAPPCPAEAMVDLAHKRCIVAATDKVVSFKIPQGHSQITVKLWGAGGGGGGGSAGHKGGAGGGGAYVAGPLPVEAGEEIKLYVGEGGKRGEYDKVTRAWPGAGWGGGDTGLIVNGRPVAIAGAGGGGAGAFGGEPAFALDGAAGGAGGAERGLRGGDAADAPEHYHGGGGRGGTQMAGGKGGTPGEKNWPGGDGGNFFGGGSGGEGVNGTGAPHGRLSDGATMGGQGKAGGGGGSGWYGGGGGGGAAGGGAGGSSLVPKGWTADSGDGRLPAHNLDPELGEHTAEGGAPGQAGEAAKVAETSTPGGNGRIVISW